MCVLYFYDVCEVVGFMFIVLLVYGMCNVIIYIKVL